MTAEEKYEAVIEFLQFIAKSGAASDLMMNQLRLGAQLWAWEEGATFGKPFAERMIDMQRALAESNRLIAEHMLATTNIPERDRISKNQ